MTFDELIAGFDLLPAIDQNKFIERAKSILKFRAYSFRYGSKVQFKVKSGKFVSGKFIRLKRKNAEVLSLYDRYGCKRGHPVTWTVSPELLVPMTPEQIKFFEFP